MSALSLYSLATGVAGLLFLGLMSAGDVSRVGLYERLASGVLSLWVLVTALHQYATPMVRHDIGDSAAMHARCPGCGLEMPTLSQLRQGV
jgi:hypothetical protein